MKQIIKRLPKSAFYFLKFVRHFCIEHGINDSRSVQFVLKRSYDTMRILLPGIRYQLISKSKDKGRYQNAKKKTEL